MRPWAIPDRGAEALERSGDRGEFGGVGRDRLDAGPPDLGLEGRRSTVGDDVAVVDDPDPVGKDIGLLQVLRGQEDRDAVLPREPRHLRPERVAALRVEAGRRLVEEEDAGPVHEGKGEVEPALHPAGVGLHLAVGSLHEADPFEQLGAPTPTLILRHPVQRGLQA